MLRLAVVATACLMLMSASALAATPAFSVHKNGTNQTVAAETDVKLTWSTEGFDTNSNFATDRFTPTVAGKYLIVLSTQCAQAGACMPSIYKNGALVARSQVTNFNIGQTPQVSAIVDMNGSTDYLEAFVNAAGTVINGTASRTYFSGMQLDGLGGGGGSSQWSDGASSSIYYNSGNVGIGTATPQSLLHVKGSTGGVLNIGYGNSTQFAQQQFSDESDNPKWSAGVIGDTNSVAAIRNGFYVYQYRDQTDASVSLYRLMISDTGNVGIGTTNPSAPLHVNTNPTSDFSRVAIGTAPGDTTDDNGLSFLTNGDENNYIDSKVGTSGKTYFRTGHGTETGFARTWMTVDAASGNVGIGTGTPGTILHVQGTQNYTGSTPSVFHYAASIGSTGLGFVGIGSHNSMPALQGMGAGTAYALHLNPAAGNVIIADGGGNVGIGTATPSSKLTVGSIANGDGLRLSSMTANHTLSILNVDDSGSRYWAFQPGSAANHPIVFLSPSNGSGYGIAVRNNGGAYNWLQLIHNDTVGILQTTGGTPISLQPSGGNVGIGTTTPQSALHVPDGKYAQFENFNTGAPPVADCDADTERGRQSIDSANFRLYICMGAARGWDFVTLNP